MYIFKKGFRPSNWTCRLSASYDGVEPIYVDGDGDYYLNLDNNLAIKNPLAYNHIMWFALTNGMTIEKDNEKICSKKLCGKILPEV